ncbi:MAG: ribonuclease Y [Candidatus Niyogibacteria bacterium CG10_big_fil_rev_8_21_14_0_10_42_19]|uniref:Ribonuclease Y n=1 Tax=Candidatus Niyogibacteria bacterium CG10_big_fil_rev_8_21_14_0_10_42_19 TaxID=1974725 RepID=A0A2H0TFG3_9BACT|nr:MAG: ribonuclease Y [Candidatus Niyogibacteria bacterium CG10_big_fil_rev_8_21_14_0_10_42_19]
MNLITLFVVGAVLLLVGAVIGYLLRHVVALQRKNSIELKLKKLLLDAKTEAQKVLEEAKKKSETVIEDSRKETRQKERDLRSLEDRIIKKEETVERRQTAVERDVLTIEKRSKELKLKQEELEKFEEKKMGELEKITGLSENEAREMLIASIEKKYENDLVQRMQKMELYGAEKMEARARDIISTVIQRLASSGVSEITTTNVVIPSEDIKGKIIGKEGRNIRAFERAAGVEVIVDETPGSVIISSFDPVRRQIAKIALENLLIDGRIQPARIEEMVDKAKMEVERMIKEAGEAAVYEVGVFDIDQRLMTLLGRLRFRTSYGQNVLQHSIEMSHLAGMLASELGADVQISKKAALLHDIGKAVDHEIQGTHVEIGRRILQKFGVDENVIKAMQAHHGDYPYESIESIIVQTADSISGGRPGARRDTVENYLKRLEELERIATAFEGIEKAYAIQAGREIRIFVTPDKISEAESKLLARKIADRIEEELKYPGEIKVHLIRETRVVEYAR